MRAKPAENLLRNCLCIRWTDGDHKKITDYCWSRRISSCSEFVRTCVNNEIKRLEVKVEEP